jgi:hypothetical protein
VWCVKLVVVVGVVCVVLRWGVVGGVCVGCGVEMVVGGVVFRDTYSGIYSGLVSG